MRETQQNPNRPRPVREFAPAKINLFLHVGAKRPDGHHDLQSLVVFARAGDELVLEVADEVSLELSGPFAADLASAPDNLVLKAARALAAETAFHGGARLKLTKNLPVASGIGGGSADAAAALRGLNALWGLGLQAEDLRRIAERIGSDVPVCVEPRPAWMEGRGEKVRALDAVAALPMVLVNPRAAVSTGKIFAALDRRSGTGLSLPPPLMDATELIAYLRSKTNDLEPPARLAAPVIGEVLKALAARPGVLIARMSGSGATCFALFEDDTVARQAAASLRAQFPQWWTVSA
jgi:4-diphosphocytidyl-2-C-methyl-D-erythritol kinase